MRAFIKLTTLFVSIMIGLILSLDLLTSFLIRKYSDFKLIAAPKYVVLGHSHPECVFNDSLIHNFKNLAQSGESYFYTYFKVKQVLEQNPSIEVVFVEYSNNQIKGSMDNWIWGERYMSYRYPIYSPFMSFGDRFFLMRRNAMGYANSFSVSMRNRVEQIVQRDSILINKIGGYSYLVRDKTDSLLSVAHPEFTPNAGQGLSEYNIFYLSRIVELCEEQRKRVVLIRSPLHKKSEDFQNESSYQEVRKVRFGDIEFMDFSGFPLSNSEFGDLEHLNHKGAKIFSKWFACLLENKLLDKTDVKGFIDAEMKGSLPCAIVLK